MTTIEINVLLALRRLSVTELAAQIGEPRADVSRVINYLAVKKRIRQKVADRLGVPVDELFDRGMMPSTRTEEASA